MLGDVTQEIISMQNNPLRTGCVLYVTSIERPSPAGVRRAQELADRSRTELKLLRVMSERQLLQDNAGMTEPEAMLTRFVEAARETSRHCREVLEDRFAEEHLMLAVGSLRECAAVHAADVDAALLVLPAGELRGRDVTALARFASRPVFVLRPIVRDAGSIVAATDLTQSDYPVLRTARDLAAQRGSSIVALHALRRPRLAAAVGAQLKKVTLALGLNGAALLPARDAVSAILDEAKRRAADVIVVGTHARAPWARAIRSSVAAQVIDRAQRSVWVEPIVE